VPGGGSLQLESLEPPILVTYCPIPGHLAASFIVNTAEAANVYKLSIRINGAEVANISLAAGNTQVYSSALSVAVNAGDVLTAWVVRTSELGFYV